MTAAQRAAAKAAEEFEKKREAFSAREQTFLEAVHQLNDHSCRRDAERCRIRIELLDEIIPVLKRIAAEEGL